MRIPCPYCGLRDAHEFSYLGDATVTRPDPAGAQEAFGAYVYERENPDGVHREYWYHAAGCRQWLVVTRNTRTHAILAAAFAREAAPHGGDIPSGDKTGEDTP